MVKAVEGVKFNDVVLFPLAQLLELAFKVAATQEVVLNICNRGVLLILFPILLSLIVGEVLRATNVYHTSGEPAFPQKALMSVVAVAKPVPVEDLREPAIFVQVPDDVSKVALVQTSFAGCAKAFKERTEDIIRNKPVT
jgi:hypothetical protein